MDTVNIFGIASAAVVVVPELADKVDELLDLPVVEKPSPSFLTYDLTQHAYDYSFTIGDLMTTVASICGMIFLAIAIYKLVKGDEPKRRKEDRWPDELIREQTNQERDEK